MTSKSAEDLDRFAVIEEKVVTASGDVVSRRYQKGRFLGKGGFARCYEFTSLDSKKLFAGKVVLKDSLKKSRTKQKLMSEIKIHRSVRHTNIVAFEHFFEDSDNVYILLEMCSNQSLSEMIRRRKRLTELEVQCYMVQLVAALKYLREHCIVHRDLKLGNMFLSEKMEIKLGDFGLATKVDFEGEKKRTICGTPNYIAPEVLDNRIGHSYEVDIWSLGVVMYTLLIGKPPFETSDVKTTYRRIRMNAYTFPENVPISPQARALITQILVTDPARRPTCDQIMASNFFNQGNAIPPLMPSSTLSCPPSKGFLQTHQTRQPSGSTTDRPIEISPIPVPVRVIATIEHRPAATERTRPAPDPVPESSRRVQGEASVGVTKWLDYSNKYGLGYELASGALGVLFNDLSKLMLAEDGCTIHYSAKSEGQKQEAVSTYSLTTFPKALQKKVTLLQHFHSYLDTSSPSETRIDDLSAGPVFVKKYLKTKYSMLFRFTNKVIQMVFLDHTEILLSGDSKVVTYVDKAGSRKAYALAEVMEKPQPEMGKRFKYLKDVLAHMLGTMEAK